MRMCNQFWGKYPYPAVGVFPVFLVFIHKTLFMLKTRFLNRWSDITSRFNCLIGYFYNLSIKMVALINTTIVQLYSTKHVHFRQVLNSNFIPSVFRIWEDELTKKKPVHLAKLLVYRIHQHKMSIKFKRH